MAYRPMAKSGLLLVTAIASLVFVSAQKSQAADLGDVRKLLQTNACKGCDLTNAKLSGQDLTDAVLVGANLEGADLSGTNLTRVNLKRANLQSTLISKANFTGANLTQANLSNAKNVEICSNPLVFGMNNPQSSGKLDYVDEQRCLVFSLVGSLGPQLCEPELGFSELVEGKRLCSIFDSPGGSLSTMLGIQVGSFFQVTSFYGADMTDAILESVDLRASDFRYANLNQTNFQDSDLTFALMLDAEIEGIADTQLESAFVTMDDIKRIVQDSLAKQTEAKRQTEGRRMIGTLVRAQQGYYLENNQFADDIDALGVRVPSPSNYTYSLLLQGDRRVVISATSQGSDLKSFLGVGSISSDGSLFEQLLCQTIEPSMTLPIAPEEIEVNQCPAGMEDL